MNCEGKVALVTGAAGSGLGRSIALTLAREGARVVVNYRTSETEAAAIVRTIESFGGTAVAIAADVFDSAECTRLVEATGERFGPVDICIVGPGGGWHPEKIDQLSPASALEDIQHETAPGIEFDVQCIAGDVRAALGTFYRDRNPPGEAVAGLCL